MGSNSPAQAGAGGLNGGTMYYVLSCKDRVRLPAQFFSMKLEDALTQILREKYERRVNKDSGVSLAVWNVKA